VIVVKKIDAVDTYKIRKLILREGILLTEKTKGDTDKSTLHLGAFSEGKLVSVASFFENNHVFFSGIQYRLRGMATLKEYQGQGFGKKLIFAAEQFLRKEVPVTIWCNARVKALGFYKKNGYQIIGEEFDTYLIGLHFVMFKEI